MKVFILEYAWKTIAKIATDVMEKMEILLVRTENSFVSEILILKLIFTSSPKRYYR
jgi:hypothetical protein